MKKIAKFVSAVLLGSVLMAAAALPALAYTPVAGGVENEMFDKYLVMDADATVPAATFTYTIEAGTAKTATADTMEILAGVMGTGAPTVGTAAFTASTATHTTQQEGDLVTLDTGKKYAKQGVKVDFSGVTFDQPGIYRYKVTEQEISGRTDITYDTQKGSSATSKVRYLDVYVVDNSGELRVSDYIFHELDGTVAKSATSGSGSATAADKSAGFVNEYKSQNLEFGKEVTGNQGSKEKYFKFTLALTGAGANVTYTVDLTKADATSGTNSATAAANRGKTNPATITTNESGAVTADFYLHDGQYVKVKGLPKGAAYTLTEDEEDYKRTAGIAAADNAGGVAYQDLQSGTIAETEIKTGFTNTREGVIPTGVAVAIFPGVAILILGILGFVKVAKKRRS